MMGRNILITGATGFIGHQLCVSLLQHGVKLRTLGRLKPEIDADFFHWDMTGALDADALAGIDTLFHLAGKAHALSETSQDADEYFSINTEGTRKLLEAARSANVRRFVLFSSVKAMGEGGPECLDESAPCHPETPYGASKLAAEKLVLEGGYVPEPVVLRLSMVYGDSEKGNLPRMIRAVAKGRFPPLPEVGNRRSMVHVDDVIQASMLAASRPEAIGRNYIVTDGTPYSTRQIYAWICEALGRPVPRMHIPLLLLKAMAHAGDGIGRIRGKRFAFDSDALDKLIGSAWYSSARLERELDFRPQRHLRESLAGMARFLGVMEA